MFSFNRSGRTWSIFLLILLFIGACRQFPGGPTAGNPDPAAIITPDNNSGVDNTVDGTANNSAGAYPSKVSVLPGESLDFHISNGYGAKYTLSIYREGATPTLMGTIPNVSTINYSCTGGYDKGCNWPVGATFTVPKDWPSGIYTVYIPRQGGGNPMKTMFFVRAPKPTARILFLSSVNTFHAYNDFGGGSLYGFGDTVKSQKVSFNRPYANGTGLYDRWESHFVTWSAAAGYKMDYAATYDLEFQPQLLNGYDLVIIAGHSEYWTWDMRQRLSRFIADGGRFMNLSGNTMWWQVRFEDNGRTMIGYKDWKKDPQKSAELSTDVNWDRPIFDSSFTITGLHWPYGGYPGGTGDGYYAINANHWIYQGTGLKEDELFGKGKTVDTSIHDKESDGLAFNCAANGSTILGPVAGTGTPANFTILGLTRVYSKQRKLDGVAMMGLYTTSAGGAAFSAGTTGWVLGLDQPAVDRITRNVMDRFLAGNFPQEPAAPDSGHLFADRFNCTNLGRGRFETTIGDAARLNYVITEKITTARLTAACGVDGAGLELPVGSPGARFVAGLGPNWRSNVAVETEVHLNLAGFNIGNGAILTLITHYADNRIDAPVAVAALQIGNVNNALSMRYQPVGGPEMPWVPAPANGFFRVNTVWDAPGDKVGLTINGKGYERQVELGNFPLPNRADFGVLQKQGSSGGTICMDNLIYDGRPFGVEPTATPTPTPTNTPTPTPTPTATPTPAATPTPQGNEIHLGDLDGGSENMSNGRWQAIVTITVHDANHAPVARARVRGKWEGGANGNGSCMTNADGVCSLNKSVLPQNSSVTFTVTKISKTGATYRSAANHDVDGGTNGTTIVINRP